MFHKDWTVEKLNTMCEGNMGQHVGIEFMEIGDGYLTARMPVDHRTKQPFGLLHGGASVVLAETLGSVAANGVVDLSRYYCVGLEINANHIRSVTKGYVYGKATPIHIGKKTQIWSIEITTEQGALVCISRLTIAVLERKVPS
jgi:1,4-dihydroxy-2-naphthoyl-CoA hydrolase